MTVKNIRVSLMKQLEDKGANVEHFASLVDDYCWYWRQEHAMQADVKSKGRTYSAVSAAGKDYEKENPCVKNAMLYNKQKLAILRELGLSTCKLVAPKNREDDAGL